MAYWGSDADESDFAAGAVGVNILQIKRRMFEEIELVKKDQFSEQSIIAHLICLRLLGERFPKDLSVHFRRKHFEEAKRSFFEWLDIAKVPDKFSDGLRSGAESEFRLFEERILNSRDA